MKGGEEAKAGWWMGCSNAVLPCETQHTHAIQLVGRGTEAVQLLEAQFLQRSSIRN